MNKIGIITITRDENYGNRLQNYAVQEVIKKLGFNAETIINITANGFNSGTSSADINKKLKPTYLMKVVKVRLSNMLMLKNDRDGILKSIFWKLSCKGKITAAQQQRKMVFSKFNAKNITFSNTTISLDDFEKADMNDYEYFVCGSDQIWNPYYPQNSMIDFLCFAPQSKRVAYAPSFGVDHIPENKKEHFRQWLLDIPFLSIREQQGATIIKELTGRDATVLVDPTLMLSKYEWLAISQKPALSITSKYILTYFLGNETHEYRKSICGIAARNSCKIINLADIREFDSFTVDPAEFIYLINNAELVCTDSFHGVVLSIIMRTHFIVFDRLEDGHSMGSRLENLLNKFGMEERLFRNIRKIEDAFNTDFSNVDRIITIEKNKAWSFLSSAIKQPASD